MSSERQIPPAMPPATQAGGGRGRSSVRGGRAGGRGGNRSLGRGGRRGGGGRGVHGRQNSFFKSDIDSSKVSQEANSKSAMPVCTFYLAGRCNFGAKCRFFHPDSQNDVLTESQQQQLQQSQNNITLNNKPKQKSTREFDVFKAEAINMAKTAQDMELNHFGTLKGPFYSMDIECVAVGYGHSNKQRYPCRVSLVKSIECDVNGVEVLMDEIVNLKNIEVVSYMTPLTGMTAEQCLDPDTKTLDDIQALVKTFLSSNSILVGHSIHHDIEWLGLKPGVDFKLSVDTSCVFRQRIPRNLGSASNILRDQVNNDVNEESEKEISHLARTESTLSKCEVKDDDKPDDSHLPFPTRYRLFSLRHSCINLLDIDIQEKAHNPIMDAKYSLILFRKYQFASPELLRCVRDSLHRAPPTPSFAAENPIVNGVVLSLGGYKLKWAGRLIWKWWMSAKD